VWWWWGGGRFIQSKRRHRAAACLWSWSWRKRGAGFRFKQTGGRRGLFMQGRERERARKASKREIRRCFNGLVYQKGHRQGAGPSAVRYSTSLLQDVCFAERPAEPDPFRPLLCDHLYCSPARGGGVTACANCFICRGGGSSRPRMTWRVTAVSGVPTAWAGAEHCRAHTLSLRQRAPVRSSVPAPTPRQP
jgi:hypothetical protein